MSNQVKNQNVQEISNHFRRNPHLLVDYIGEAVARKVLVVGTHIVQLAKMVEVTPLGVDDKEYPRLPEVFVSPLSFKNIQVIVSRGQNKFPWRSAVSSF